MSAKPTFTLEVSFTTGIYVTPVWVDISAYVMLRTIKVVRGRNYEQAEFEAGSIEGIVLNNSDGRFSPQNTSGAYYPNVKPLKQIRLRVIYNGTTYDIFRGYVTAWQADITIENRETIPVVNLSVTDILATLAQTDIKSYVVDSILLKSGTVSTSLTMEQDLTEYRFLSFYSDEAAQTGNITLQGNTLEFGTNFSIFALTGTTPVKTAERYNSIDYIIAPARVAIGEVVTVETYGFPAEFANNAFTSLLVAYGIDGAFHTVLGVGNVITDIMPSSGDTLLGRIQKIAATEGGRVYVAKDGRVTFENRYVRSLASSSGTFSATNTALLTYSDIELSFDDTLIVNTIEYEGILAGAIVTKYRQNTVSVAAYGRRYGTLPEIFDDDTSKSLLADVYANRYAEPRERVNALTFKPNSQPDLLWLIALNMEISQYYTVNVSQPNLTLTFPVFVERVEHTFTAQLVDWETTISLSPEYVSVYFVLDVHRLDDDKRLGY